MILVDTNVFLEILLAQDKKKLCKSFLSENDDLFISDLSLHSIGIILFRYGKLGMFQKFMKDIEENLNVLSLPLSHYYKITEVAKHYRLDFDDAYQYSVAKHYGLKIATMDSDFKRVENVEVVFL